MPTTYYDKHGRVIALGDKIAEGGEGAVFSVQGAPTSVAKLYKKAIDQQKAEKLEIMASLDTSSIASFAAWPVATLHSKANGPVEGFVMPRIDGASEIHEVYNPSHRKQSYPLFDYRHLIRCARNVAVAVAKLHETDIVIGDINQGNFLVNKQAMVKMIDCDSFQITSSTGVYKCYVGVPHFTPPELQTATDFSQVVRTRNHDNFGLAIIIFHLLCMGRHPFVGYRGNGDMTVEQAIRENRFAYGINAARYQMAPPPNALTSKQIFPEVFALFEQAFAPDASRPNGRPTAMQWATSLEKLESGLRKCTEDESHYFWSRTTTCPWCDMAKNGGPNFFVSAVGTPLTLLQPSGPPFNLDEIVAAIRKIPPPGTAFPVLPVNKSHQPLPISAATPTNAKDELRLILFIISVVLLAFGSVGLFFTFLAMIPICLGVVCGVIWHAMWAGSPYAQERSIKKEKLTKAETLAARLEKELKTLAATHTQAFSEKMNIFNKMRTDWLSIDSNKKAEIAGLHQSIQARQLEAHLKSFFISNASIPGIGPTRITLLESYGIDSAWYVSPQTLEYIPGIGPELSYRILAWRSWVESQFRFDPSQSVTASAIQSVDLKYARMKNQLEASLRAAPGELKKINDQYNQKVAHQAGLLDEANRRVAIARDEFKTRSRFRF